MDNKVRQLYIKPALWEKLEDHAWRRRKNTGELVRWTDIAIEILTLWLEIETEKKDDA